MSLAALFTPRAIAVVGASNEPHKPGYHMTKCLGSFNGPLYPINPKADEVLGHRCYSSLAAVGAPIDLAILIVPASACPQALQEAADAGARAALIVSGGFGETGGEGERLQAELKAICAATGIRLLGPNTAGFTNPAAGFSACFVPGLDTLAASGIAVVAQSAGVFVTLSFMLQAQGYGVRLAMGLGNSINVTAADVIDFLADDPATKVIALHIEGVANGRALIEAVKRASPRKPVVLLTVGQADVATFAQSHTGNLVGSYAIKTSTLAQAGAVVVETPSAMVDAVIALSHRRLGAKANPGVALLTGQAGPGLLMLDALKRAGVDLPDLADATVETIAAQLPPLTYLRNPVDVGRPSPALASIMESVAADPVVDVLLSYALHEPDAVDAVALFGTVAARTPKPLVFGTQGAASLIAPTWPALRDAGIPAYPAPDKAAQAVRALVEDAKAQAALAADAAPIPAYTGPAAKPGRATEAQAKTLLDALGIPTPPRRVCDSRAAAHDALGELGGPLVVKVLSADILHKSDVGGVHVGVRDAAAMDAALDAIDAIDLAGPRRYLVEAMAGKGVDLIVGGLNDPSFGPILALGLGGTEAELFKDVTQRAAPFGLATARRMIDALTCKPLLTGWRGAAKADTDALAHTLVKLAAFLAANPAISEFEINPLRVLPSGVVALDAVLLVNE